MKTLKWPALLFTLTAIMALFMVLIVLIVLALSFYLPETKTIPVAKATPKDWNHQSFWFEPWGKSGVHKGIDIFAPEGQAVLSTTNGLILKTGYDAMGGNYILILGPRLQTHYYAHLADIKTQAGKWVTSGEAIGSVGKTGNAKTAPPHLHYSIRRLIPDPTQADNSTQGYKKAYFVNPHEYLTWN